MSRTTPSETRPSGMLSPSRLIALLVTVCVLAQAGLAQAQFRDLLARVPRSANAVILLNMEKAKQSPMGVREAWAKKIEKSFEAGLIPVPPQAARFVLASQIDLEFMEPVWSVAMMEVTGDVSLEQVAKRRGGTLDKLKDLPGVVQPNDTYLVQFGPKVLGAMAPANRQSVLRWIRETQEATPGLSPYLQKAAGFSDDAGTEIIMAIDLEGVLSPARVAKFLEAHKELLEKSQADPAMVAKVLGSIEGVRLGIRIGDRPSGALVVDFGELTVPLSAIAKPLLLQALTDGGMQIDDIEGWDPAVKGKTISLAGNLTTSGLQRVMSLVESPTSSESVAPAPASPPSPGELEAQRLKASLDHFHAVTGMARDLQADMRSSKSLASTATWFDKYARRIQKLPILNVDEELLKYSAFVADGLRQAAVSVRMMGIQSRERQAQITSSGAGYSNVAYGYGRYGMYGGYGGAAYGTAYNPRAEARGITSERMAIGAQEKGAMATDVQGIRSQIISATADIRRKMTQKYHTEF